MVYEDNSDLESSRSEPDDVLVAVLEVPSPSCGTETLETACSDEGLSWLTYSMT